MLESLILVLLEDLEDSMCGAKFKIISDVDHAVLECLMVVECLILVSYLLEDLEGSTCGAKFEINSDVDPSFVRIFGRFLKRDTWRQNSK